MSEELYFNNELRNCLDAAVYSDCGENDQWNYWYQRLRKAHDAAVDRVTETQRAENAKLRELVVALYHIHFGTEEESWDAWEDFCPCTICEERHGGEAPCAYTAKDLADECCEPITKEIVINRMRELGVEP